MCSEYGEKERLYQKKIRKMQSGDDVNNCVSPGFRGDKRKSLIGHYLARKYEKVLSIEGKLSKEHGDDGVISNREMIANIAVSLFDATWERLKVGKDSRAKSIDDDFEEFAMKHELESISDSFWLDENFREESEGGDISADDVDVGNSRNVKGGGSSSKLKKIHSVEGHDHFVDILLDKMISALLPDDLPEREQFTQRVHEPGRRKSHPISVVIMSRNLKIMTAKLGLLFEFQDSIIRLITWRNPSGTITALMLFSFICFNPMLLPIISLGYVLFGLMIPGYLHRHPLRRNFYLTKRVYGKSLLVTVATGGKPSNWQGHDNVLEYDYNNLHTEGEDWERAQNIRQTLEFIVNLRDLQNLMTATVLATENLEKFVYGDAGFKNERRSTILFLSGLLALVVLWCMSPFINWSVTASVGAWAGLLTLHPRVLPKLTDFINEEQIEKGKEVMENVEKYDIILDEQPEVRYLEVFEIYKQGLTPQQWDFYTISSHVFDPMDKYRKSQTPPPGVTSLEFVTAPSTWCFDKNSEWVVDKNVEVWANERGLSLAIDGEFLVDDAFKRKRLTRKVVRYANPARKPAYR
ncbi:Pex28p Ecym_2076 [Eremothecium cymbalariae DBVPG|uniref:TECPR1-like DysF domain-containing protein n=1 Tax=Eremothecium cymbalariae (strain CBS 270.75 / DBVPG 7215 / KCTC 17166 / NRRL Y-17582) TaxID=931890 RepID=G8JPI3_ERECY|nr:Hypothetical protein Ecym_2076 [Eremothecium cymbalariae DBVPG\